MASLFRYGQQEKRGSGRKIQHGRRRLPPLSPYSRPSEPKALAPLPLLGPDPPAGGSPSWLRGLISGAGKIISSVLDSDSGDSSSSGSSSGFSSDEDYDPFPNEPGDHLPSKEKSSFSKEKGKCVEEGNVELLAIVPKSESKSVIEQLLMQETFSRAECNEMLKIIQSRVVEIPSAADGEEKHYEAPNSFMGRRAWSSFDQIVNSSGITNYSLINLSSISPRFYNSEAIAFELCNKAFPSADDGEEKHHEAPNIFMGRRTWKSFDQIMNPSGITNYSPSNLSSIYPRFYNSEAITPELCNKAILEAKKWLEDQKMAPTPKPDQEIESCIWNINLKEYQGFGNGIPPVELAKLYVQSLHSWRSPTFSNNALKNHPESLKHFSITGTNLLHQSMDIPCLKEEHYHLRKLPLQSQDIIELRGNTHFQEEANGLADEIGTSQKVAEDDNIYFDLDSINDEDLISANYSNGDAVISISDVPLRSPNDVSSDFPITQVTGIRSNTRKNHNGTKIKSNERILIKPPQPSRVYHRLKKVVNSKIGSDRGI